MARRVLIGFLALALVVMGLVGGLWALQRHLIYFPDTKEVPPAGSMLPGGRDVTLHTSDGLRLGAWFAPPIAGDRGWAVLLAPGNGGNRAGRAGLATELARRGFAVLLMDYRGYGGNPGSPSEVGLARDADAAVAALTDLGYPPKRTIYFGESLGTAVVAGLQERHPPAGVVLRSPFPELPELGAHHYPWLPVRSLLRDRFPVTEPMANSEVPVAVIFGDRDQLVPPEFSRQVSDRLPHLRETVALRGADHNDPVMFGPEVARTVARFADGLGRG